MNKNLKAAFISKEKAELLLKNLENHRAEKSIIESQYEILKADYNKRLENAVSEISSMKAGFQKKYDAKNRELNTYNQELSILRSRLQIGEIRISQFVKMEKKLKRKVAELEKQVVELQKIVGFKSSKDLGIEKIKKENFEKIPVLNRLKICGKWKYTVLGAVGLVLIIAIVLIVQINFNTAPEAQTVSKNILLTPINLDSSLLKIPLYKEYNQNGLYYSKYYSLSEGQEVYIIIDADIPIYWGGLNELGHTMIAAGFLQVIFYDQKLDDITSMTDSNAYISKTDNNRRAVIKFVVGKSKPLGIEPPAIGIEPQGKRFFKFQLLNDDIYPHRVKYSIVIK